ncbi:MAG: hypothetical protein ACJ8AW_52425 [Rhodopila sp.]|jgi:hypothetical protein
MATRPSRPVLGGSLQVVASSGEGTEPASQSSRTATGKAAARIGKVQLSGYIDIDYKRQLDIHAAREGITIQSIIEEMYDLYATAHGLHRLGNLHEGKKGGI